MKTRLQSRIRVFLSDDHCECVMTPREREVLTLLAEGLANKEVASRLGISVRTAETHRGRLSHKLNILSLAGLTKYAILNGLTPLGLVAPAPERKQGGRL